MGIYVFSLDKMLELLNSPGNDFGKNIIPAALESNRVMGYVFDGYWADIGTIRRFYEVNLEMASPDRPFDFNIPGRPIYTHPRFLPPSETYGAQLNNVFMGEGCRIYDATITKSVIGSRSIIGSQVNIQASVLMGADFYETKAAREENERSGRPHIGIGDGSVIEAAIIDKNARIGKNVQIRNIPDRVDGAEENWVSRDGLIIIPKGAVVPDETVI